MSPIPRSITTGSGWFRNAWFIVAESLDGDEEDVVFHSYNGRNEFKSEIHFRAAGPETIANEDGEPERFD